MPVSQTLRAFWLTRSRKRHLGGWKCCCPCQVTKRCLHQVACKRALTTATHNRKTRCPKLILTTNSKVTEWGPRVICWKWLLPVSAAWGKLTWLIPLLCPRCLASPKMLPGHHLQVYQVRRVQLPVAVVLRQFHQMRLHHLPRTKVHRISGRPGSLQSRPF